MQVLLHLTDPKPREGGHRHWVGLEVRTSLTVPPGWGRRPSPGTSAIWATALPEWLLNDPGLCLTHSSPAVPSPGPWASGNTSSAFWEPPWAQTKGEAPTVACVPRTADPNRLLPLLWQARDAQQALHPLRMPEEGHTIPFFTYPPIPLKSCLSFTQPAVSPDLPLAWDRHRSRGLFATLWTIPHQALLSMGFSRQEYWSGLPCPPPGNLPHPRIEPESLTPPALAGRFFTTSTTWKGQAHPARQTQVPGGSEQMLSFLPPSLQVIDRGPQGVFSSSKRTCSISPERHWPPVF